MFASKKSKTTRKNNTRRPRPQLGMETFEDRKLMAFGAEFAIGSEIVDSAEVATASNSQGMSVAVWTAESSGNDTDILGQLYNADGTKRGGTINIATGTSRDSEPAVAMENNGDFAVSFTREHNHGFLNLSTDKDIRVERFNASGQALGGNTAVTTSNSEQAYESDIAMDADGDFVVTYTAESTKTRTVNTIFGPWSQSFTDKDVRGRRFNRFGNAVGGTFSIDTTSTRFEQNPSIDMADNGRFMVAYEDGGDIHVRRFNANATLRGTRFIATTGRTEQNPDISLDSSGDAVIVWQDSTNGSDVKARRLSDAGTRGGVVNIRTTSASEMNPSVAMTDDGDYIVGYSRNVSSGGLVASRIDTTRVTSGNTVQGHQNLGQGIAKPSISVDGNDRYFIGYNDFIDQQNRGRFGQMGSFAPTDKTAHDFDIEIDFTGFNATQRNIFRQAADRWEEVIVGDLPGMMIGSRFVDDVLIDAIAAPIDGVSNILGQAGPDRFRSGSLLPFHGNMRFDTADIANMQSNGTLFNVILHEMGHVLGFGTLWDDLGLIEDEGTDNVRYTGTNGVAGFNAARGFMGFISPATSIPVESDGGAGTADSHWDEDTFDTELMTGFVENTGAMPLSRMTVGSLDDLGYDVNYRAADPYSVTPLFRVARPITFLGGGSALRDDDSGDEPNMRASNDHQRSLGRQSVDQVFDQLAGDVVLGNRAEQLDKSIDDIFAFLA